MSLRHNFLREEIHSETFCHQGGEDKADKGEQSAPEQRPPKTNAFVQQPWQEQEHRQGRDDIPEGVESVIRQLGRALLLEVQPHKHHDGDKGQLGNERTDPVAALGQFGDQHNDKGRHRILRDQKGHLRIMPFGWKHCNDCPAANYYAYSSSCSSPPRPRCPELSNGAPTVAGFSTVTPAP